MSQNGVLSGQCLTLLAVVEIVQAIHFPSHLLAQVGWVDQFHLAAVFEELLDDAEIAVGQRSCGPLFARLASSQKRNSIGLRWRVPSIICGRIVMLSVTMRSMRNSKNLFRLVLNGLWL